MTEDIGQRPSQEHAAGAPETVTVGISLGLRGPGARSRASPTGRSSDIRQLAGISVRTFAFVLQPGDGDHDEQRCEPQACLELAVPGPDHHRPAQRWIRGQPNRLQRHRLHRLQHRDLLRAERDDRRGAVDPDAGLRDPKTCAARGISSTASIAIDPATSNPAVYVAGGDGYLYALDAGTGAVLWKSVIGIPSATKNDFYDWSSPAVANGLAYIGVSSQCDQPLVANAGSEGV